MKEQDVKQMILELKVEIETLKTLLIQRGKINSMEYELLKKKILDDFKENHRVLGA